MFSTHQDRAEQVTLDLLFVHWADDEQEEVEDDALGLSGGRTFSAFLEISLSQKKSKSLDMDVNNAGKKGTEKKPSR